MIYEELKFRPSSGAIDRNAITAWLAAKDYAFLDPITGEVWHLSSNKKEMEDSRHERIANPARMPWGALVLLLPDHVSVNAYRAGNAEGRALEFIRWLVSDGEWAVQRDWGPFEPVGDPARLFPEGTGEPDHTINDLTEGVRYTWEAAARSFVVHSSGQWRTRLTALTEKWRVIEDWRGELSPPAMTEWMAAVANAGELIEYANPDSATGSFDIEDDSGLERAWFDAGNIPDPLKPIGLLVERWGRELAGWTKESTSDDLRRVRRE